MELLQIPRRLLTRLLAYCQAEAPQEACGLLTGRAGVVRRAYPLPNRHPESHRAFRIDPVDEHTVLQQAGAAGEQILAIFHSHPASIAYPSSTDLHLARTGVHHLIVSLAQHPPDVRAYRLAAGQLQPVPFRILDGPVGDWVSV